jgi:ABC-type methionine transport system permease subunit
MSSALIDLVWQSTLETLYMVAVAGILSALAGVPLGVLLSQVVAPSILIMEIPPLNI